MENKAQKVLLGTTLLISALVVMPKMAQAMAGEPLPRIHPVDGQSCHYLSIKTCTLPFPSNQYTVEDVSSPTGLTVDLKGTLFSKQAEDEIIGFGSPDIYANKSGFSAAAPVLFELSSPFAKSSLPSDGGDAFIVFNRSSGQREAIRAGHVKYAAKEKRFGATATTVIEAFPRSRFQYGAHYVAVITKSLKPVGGDEYTTVPAIQALAAGKASAEVQASYGEAFDYVVAQGVSPDEIISLTTFTVIDEHSNNAEFYELIDVVENDDHPVRGLKTTYVPVGYVAAIIKGQVRLTDLRDIDSGRVRYTPGMQGRPYWTDFVLKIPRAAQYGKVPIAIFGHGVIASKETENVSYINARQGVATINIDQPYHGSRRKLDGINMLFLPSPENIPRVSGLVVQSSLDLHSLISAIKTSLAHLNVVPRNTWLNRSVFSKGVSSPDIDTDQILYQGTSLGGVLGSTFASTARDLKGAFMYVTGVGLSNILSHSRVFEGLDFDAMVPSSATGGDAGLFFHAVQTEVDIADGINFVHYARQGGYGRLPRPIAIQYGVDDGIVFNQSSEAFAEIADLPLVGRTPQPVSYLKTVAHFEDGYGVVQTPPLIPTGTVFDDLLGHASFIRLDASIQTSRWLRQVTD
jgi:hypothetical protein